VSYLVGFHPPQNLCLVGLNDSKVTCATTCQRPMASRPPFAAELIAMVAEMSINVVLHTWSLHR